MTADGTESVQAGVLLPTREQTIAGNQRVGALLDFGEAAEQAGFDSVWAGDSLLARPRIEPLALLAALAARTAAITLGTAILLGPLRHPVLLAHQAATVDLIAEGRLILGLGAGFPYPATEAEFAAVEVPFEQRVGRLLETIEICRRLWRSDDAGTVTFRGRHFELDEVRLLPKPSRPGGPPLWLAGEGPRALASAGRVADGWLPYSPTAEVYRQRRAQVDGHAGAAGREQAPTAALYCTIALDEDAERARLKLDAYVQAYYGLPLDAMRHLQAFYAGDAQGCVGWLEGYVAGGARHIIIRLGCLTGHREGLEALAEVATAVRAPGARPVPATAEAA